MWTALATLGAAALKGGMDAYGSWQAGQNSASASSDANLLNYVLAHEAMNWNAEQAGISRAYNTQMSNTAYQRAVKDLRKAGLNPILAAFSGGASTPASPTAQTSAATVDPVRKPSLGESLARGASSAYAMYNSEREQSRADALNEAQVTKLKADTIRSGVNAAAEIKDILAPGGVVPASAKKTAGKSAPKVGSSAQSASKSESAIKRIFIRAAKAVPAVLPALGVGGAASAGAMGYAYGMQKLGEKMERDGLKPKVNPHQLRGRIQGLGPSPRPSSGSKPRRRHN